MSVRLPFAASLTWSRSRRLPARGLATLVALMLPLTAVAPAALAADAPEPPPVTVKLYDLGETGGSHVQSWPFDINNKGEVVGKVLDSDPEAPDPSWPYTSRPFLWTMAGGQDLSGRLGGDATPRWNNDAGAIGGSRTNDRYWLAPPGGSSSEITQPFANLTEDGVLVVPDGLLWPGGEHRVLTPESGRYTEFDAANTAGQVVGSVNVAADPANFHNYQSFRTRPGERLDETKDLLSWGDGKQSIAADINESGVVVGKGLDDRNSYVPVWWDSDVQGHQAPARFTAGYLNAVNDAGIAVGIMADGAGFERAAFWDLGSGGLGTFLQDLLPADSPYVLDSATGVNEQDQVIGLMHRVDHQTESRAYVLDLSFTDSVAVEGFEVQHRDVPSGDWIPVPALGTYDGNIIRLRAQVKNPTPYPAFVTVQFTDAEGGPLRDGKVEDVIPARSSVEETLERDTAGQAWAKDGSPRTDAYRYGVTVTVGGQVKDEEHASVIVLPRPVVLVHGYKSNAQSSWGTFKSDIISTGHPYLKGYAVGDGEFDGLMHTGDPAHPFDTTNTIQENATEEGVYIADLRSTLDAWHVDIVAHSMGGLMSRYYVQQLMPDPVEYDGRAVVNRLIQLGTPNVGSPCADLLLQLDEGTGDASILTKAPFMPATLQLSQPYLKNVYNPVINKLDGVRISNEVGVDIPIPCGELELGDVVVPASSARWMLRDYVETGTWHLGMTEDVDDYNRYVLPRLKDAPVAADSVVDGEVNYGLPAAETTLTPGEPPAAPADPNAPADAASFSTRSVDVAGGATTNVALDVPAGDSFGVTGAIPPTVGLALVDPSGTTRASFAPDSEGATALFPALRVDGHTAGRWTLRVTNAASGTASVPVVAWVAGGAVGLGASAYPQDSGGVLVQAQVLVDGSPAAAPVTATVTGADGERVQVDLVDDGEHSDGAAGDGLYGGASAPLPDGDVVAVVRAEGEGWSRSVVATTTARTVDRSDKTLTVTSQPGGTATAEPAGPTYPYGTGVTLTPRPRAGELPLGWVVDGADRPAGPLRLTMDRDHTVLAKFGHYTLTPLPALHGGWASETYASRINAHGQVAATSSYGGYQSRDHSVGYVWQDGKVSELVGAGCADATGGGAACDTTAVALNDSGVVLGSTGGTPTVWKDGAASLLSHAGPASASNAATDVSPSGVVLGGYQDSMPAAQRWGTWSATNPSAGFSVLKAADATPGGTGSRRVNNRGEMALDKTGFNALGQPSDWWPAKYAKGVLTKLPRPADYCVNDDWTSGHATGINASGQVAGYLMCGQQKAPDTAVVWNGTTPTVLGAGQAYGITDGGVVFGVSPVGSDRDVPTIWADGTSYHLADYLPGGCPADRSTQTTTCFLVTSLLDMNDSGDMLIRGAWVDPGQEYYPALGQAYVLRYSTADADLEVTQSAPLAEVGAGTTTTRTVTVTNHGADAATQVTVDLVLPAGLSVTGCTATSGECAPRPDGRSLLVPELAAGAAVTMTVTATVPAAAPTGSSFVTKAWATSQVVRDPDVRDNRADVGVTVQPFLNDGIAFPNAQQVGSTSAPVERTLTNRSEEPLSLGQIAVPDGFVVSSACSGRLAPGASCGISVNFRPTEARTYSGALGVEATPYGPFTAPLSGTGVVPNAAPVVPRLPEQLGLVGRDLTLVVPFTDEDVDDIHTAVANWGSGAPTADGVQVLETPGSGAGEVRLTRRFDAPTSGSALVLLSDSAGHTTFALVPFRVTEAPANQAPVLAALAGGEAVTGRPVTREGSFTDPGSTSWTATVDYGDGTAEQPLTLTGSTFALSHAYAEPGTWTTTVRVADDGGLVGTTSFVTVVSPANTAPGLVLEDHGDAVEGAAWSLSGSVVDPDADDAWTVTATYGDGQVEQVPLDGKAFTLSHRWQDDGVGTVAVTVVDRAGGSGETYAGVYVANAAPTVHLTGPERSVVVRLGDAVSLSAAFADAGVLDSHAAAWTLAPVDGGSAVAVAGVVDEAAGSGTVGGVFRAGAAGSYRVTVSVRDEDGGIGTAAVGADGAPVTVTVVDPAWHVEGHGAVAAPSGSCRLTPTCGSSGGTAFELSAHYGQGVDVEGALRLTTSGFTLVGDRMDTLVVSGSRAVVTGSGAVNGGIPVRFTVTAAAGTSTAPPALRVRVWRTDAAQTLLWDDAPDGLPGTGAGKVSGRLSLG